MDKQRLVICHWEALYPFDLVHKGLSSLKLPDEFPKDAINIALPHDYLVQAVEKLQDTGFKFGSSDMLDAQPESFTSSIATEYLVASHANFVMLGKAFNRHHLKESSVSVNHKIRASLGANITPFVCFGETREEFEDGHTEEVLKKQLESCLTALTPTEIQRLYFVYDTPWTLKSISDVQPHHLTKTYEIAHRQLSSLLGDEPSHTIKIICALEPFKPLPKEYITNSPFAGFYFKMIDTNLSYFVQAAKEIAPYFSKITQEMTSEVDNISSKKSAFEEPLQTHTLEQDQDVSTSTLASAEEEMTTSEPSPMTEKVNSSQTTTPSPPSAKEKAPRRSAKKKTGDEALGNDNVSNNL